MPRSAFRAKKIDSIFRVTVSTAGTRVSKCCCCQCSSRMSRRPGQGWDRDGTRLYPCNYRFLPRAESAARKLCRRINKNNQNLIIDSYSRLSYETCSRSFSKTRIGLLSRSSDGRLVSRQCLACSSRLICELSWASPQVLSETIVSVLAVKLA